MSSARHVTSEDCQGNATSYWQATLVASDGHIILANSGGAWEAEQKASERLDEYEAFIRQSPHAQLAQLVEKQRMCPNDQERAIKLIAKILLDQR